MNTTAVARMEFALDRHDGNIDATRAWAEIFDRSILETLEAYEMGEIADIEDGE